MFRVYSFKTFLISVQPFLFGSARFGIISSARLGSARGGPGGSRTIQPEGSTSWPTIQPEKSADVVPPRADGGQFLSADNSTIPSPSGSFVDTSTKPEGEGIVELSATAVLRKAAVGFLPPLGRELIRFDLFPNPIRRTAAHDTSLPLVHPPPWEQGGTNRNH